TLENGKNRYESIADVDEAIDFMRYYSHEIEANNGFRKEMGQAYPSERTSSTLRPYGVWTVIAPFNFPVAIATGMSVGALITGNTIVFKPASDTPLTGLRLYEILTEAGLPEGVMNYVTGSGGEIGSELVENPRVAGIVFTGSLEVGMSIYSSLSKGRAKPFIAEMGGKNPTIVTAKADVEAAVEGVALSAFGYGGQKCSACSRVYVQRELLADFTAKLVERTKQLTVGNPTLKENYMGPVINDRAYRNFQHYAEIAQTDGKVLTGGRVKSEGELRHGFYVEPTIVADLPVDHRFFKEELFLPILSVAPFDSFDEALKLANSVEYGLTAGIFTQDEGEMAQFFDRIEAGVAYANRKMGATTGAMVGAQPFVGWKLSGITGRGAGGPHYLPQFMREQSRTKVVT
ncbi:MAG: aldehyde dehydrogenase family protein, partial [Candidatus Bathyarchaeia archaeon]